MEIVINGESQQVPAPLSVVELLRWLDLQGDRIAVELNREILRRDQWAATHLKDQDHLEIVRFVGGG
ncbi:MAG: sulfur carrier protein ThiS [Acidobacteria bacterium]|nr:sulfur carrier protein ThiS [Acidobacteriota bacterium]